MKQLISRALAAVIYCGSIICALSSSNVHSAEMRRVVSDYAITPEAGLGIVRAFYYGPNSVIEFEVPPNSFSAVDAQGKQVEFEPEGRFVRLIGRPTIFTAMFSGKAATFRAFTETARIPKPTVDELAKFDNFYAGQTAAPTQTNPSQRTTQPAPQTVAAEPVPVPASVPASSSKQLQPATEIAQTKAAATAAIHQAPLDHKKWRVQLSDISLKGALMRWSVDAGWQLSWEITQDIPVTLTATFDGSFEEAASKVFESLAGSDAPMKGCLYDNNVLRVVTRATRCELQNTP